MFDYLSGELRRNGDGQCVVDVGGAGYLLTVSANTARSLPAAGSPATLLVHFVHREDAMELIGFAAADERLLFRRLVELPGIGPRQALKILSGMPLADFTRAVIAGDTATLTRIPGLGAKTAEKLVFELKGKLLPPAGEAAGPAGPAAGGTAGEAAAALEALGVAPLAARGAVRQALTEAPDEPLADLVRRALRHI